MIDVSDVVSDFELGAPQPFQILRSTGQWVLGGFQSTVLTISQAGPVQRATDKEIAMIPEGDRVGGVMAFWCTVPVYDTRAKLPVPSIQQQVPQGALPGSTFTVTGGLNVGNFYVNGLLQAVGVDYFLTNGVITTTYQLSSGSVLLFTNSVSDLTGTSASDILVYPPNGEQYRVLAVRHHPGSGYWRAFGTRMSAV